MGFRKITLDKYNHIVKKNWKYENQLKNRERDDAMRHIQLNGRASKRKNEMVDENGKKNDK